MEKEKIINVGNDMIYLSACALHSKIPDVKIVENMDLERVFRLSVRHSMQAITLMAIESLIASNADFANAVAPELLNQWRIEKGEAIRNNVLFEAERNKIAAFLEKENIWYMFLKGAVMEKYYPRLGMRQMCDNDILFDGNFREKVRDYMTDNNYIVKSYNKGYPDSYIKAPVILFEMHFSLYTEYSGEKMLSRYYENVKRRLIRNSPNGFEYRFNNEDFYIYSTTHAYKHFSGSGNGIRSLMDVFVFLQKMGEEFNFEYVEHELQKLGIGEFEKFIRILAFKLFSKECRYLNGNDCLSQEELETLAFYLGSGVFGTKENRIKTQVKKGIGEGKKTSRMAYVLRRIFPDMSYYKVFCPTVYKYKFLIPFYVIYRIIYRSIVNFKNIAFEVKLLFKNKK